MKLKSLVNRKIGYGIVQPGASCQGGVPIIKAGNVIAGLTSVDLLDTTAEENDAKYKRTKLSGGELLVTVVGSVGKTAIVPKRFAGCNIVRATALIDILDYEDALWVKYYIDSPAGQNYITQNLNTTVQPTLNIKSLEEMDIPMPGKEIRDKVVGLLSLIDEKIDNNKQIIANITEQAKSLYKATFVTFERCNQALIDGLPIGWKYYRLSEFLPVITGKKNANVSSDAGEYPFFSCSQEISWTNEYSFEGDAILVAGNGDFNVKFYHGKFEAYQRTYVLIPEDSRYTAWLYYAVDYYLKEITSAARGSVIKFITKGNLEEFQFAGPLDLNECTVIDVFSQINENIANIRKENLKLEELRKTLIPRLISGEIDISALSI